MAERRSNRSKKVVDYAKFAATADNDDDFEEFKAQPTKRAKVDIKEKDNVQANTLKNGKPTSENRTESLPIKAQSVKQNRLPLEEKVLQRQIKQALEVSKSDIVDDEASDSEKHENSCSSSSSGEEDPSEDEFRPSKKQVKKAAAPAKQKKITNTVENDKTSKIKETLNGTESSEEKSNASKLVVKADDVKNDHTESDNDDDSQSSDQSSSQSSEESTSEPSEESSNHSSDESNSNNEEFQPIKKQNKKVNAANKKAKSATKAQHAIPKKEIKVAATLVVNGAEVLKAMKPIVQEADELKKDIITIVPTTGKGSIISALHSSISNSAAKRKGPISSPAIPSKNSVQMPLKGIRIGLSRKISRKPLHPSVKPQS